MLTGFYILYVIVGTMFFPTRAQGRRQPRDVAILAACAGGLARSFLPLAALILSVLGAILFGLATPSEAAADGCRWLADHLPQAIGR